MTLLIYFKKFSLEAGPFFVNDAASVGGGGVDSGGVLQASLGNPGEESEAGGAGVV